MHVTGTLLAFLYSRVGYSETTCCVRTCQFLQSGANLNAALTGAVLSAESYETTPSSIRSAYKTQCWAASEVHSPLGLGIQAVGPVPTQNVPTDRRSSRNQIPVELDVVEGFAKCTRDGRVDAVRFGQQRDKIRRTVGRDTPAEFSKADPGKTRFFECITSIAPWYPQLARDQQLC